MTPTEDARYTAFVIQATVLLPISCGLFVGVVAFVGPHLMALAGPAPEPGLVERLLFCAGAHRGGVSALGGLACGAGLVGVRAPGVGRWFGRAGLLAPMVGKLLLCLPVVAAVGLLLLSAVTPLLRALSVKP